ncbi:MAG TPA: PPOX class F420-dependent oxidoreductase [Candidatus Bathyarchaeia archaeon]|nr:PPOX class F420-dependent oxidoreductase [Candidatus Bathyarchaeia archaeon]
MSGDVSQLTTAKYFSLETFRKTGVGVRTPVWFAEDPAPASGKATYYVYTLPDSGKVKRIRNNSSVRINPCNMRGNVHGTWVNAHARICRDDEAEKGQTLLIDKYGLMKRIGDFFSRLRGRVQCVLAIEVG